MSILQLKINKNDTICGCEGVITLNASGGIPPYFYSIDGGVTYSDFPIFTNLCSGLYTVKLQDITGTTRTTNININEPSNPILYTTILNTTSSIISNNGITVTKQYNTTIDIIPPLPSGVTAIIDITHNNNFNTSPNSGSSTNITSSTLYKNNISQIITSTGITTGTTISFEIGCQGNPIYITSTYDKWESLTINNNDTVNISTITTVIKNENINCYLSNSEEIYTLSNLRLSGCGCCNIISG